MLARPVAPVVEVPQLGPLVARVPLAELVAQREHALLGARLLLVAAPAAEHGVEPVPEMASSSGCVWSGLRVPSARSRRRPSSR
ncbi:hypothetical protein BJF88_11290 [Cellulosimicrobium sp. CUA-896]|nr:hypothetical protein BJF88_11290 [Cellulosimicrobium sp. CUA-896]